MKKLAIVLAAAAAFDLGTVVVPAQAASVDYFLKLDGVKEQGYMKFKLDQFHTPQACKSHGGQTIVGAGGQGYCNIPNSALQDFHFTSGRTATPQADVKNVVSEVNTAR